MKMLFTSAGVLVFLFLWGCTANLPSEPDLHSAAPLEKGSVETRLVYAYSGYNRDGLQIVRGELTFAFGEGGRVSGQWHLRALVDTARIGPQHGSGSLTGTLNNGTLSVNLNPRFVDNNVILSGRFDRTSYAGRWQWIGFPGVINHGTFRAARIRPLDAVKAVAD